MVFLERKVDATSLISTPINILPYLLANGITMKQDILLPTLIAKATKSGIDNPQQIGYTRKVSLSSARLCYNPVEAR